MLKKISEQTNIGVFLTSALILLSIVFCGIIFPSSFPEIIGKIQEGITDIFGFWYIGLISIVTVLYALIAISKYGKIKLGDEHIKPRYTTFTWFSMLFCCGIGVGVVFWGVAEPMTHFMMASPYNPTAAGNPEDYETAMKIAIFHWGINGWIGYIAIGLPMGYFAFRYKLPFTVSSTLYGLLDNKTRGPISFIIDVISIFATVLGVSTTLGMGLMTMSFGIEKLFGITTTNTVLAILMLMLIITYTISSYTGIDKGIKHLSRINIYLALILILFIFFTGPTRFQINLILNTAGAYFSHVFYMMFYTNPAGDYTPWMSSWTVFYWAWFLSWGPFTGGFIAKISEGRNLRQFIAGSVMLPTICLLVWFCVLGGSSMYYQSTGVMDIWDVIGINYGGGIFALLDVLPFTPLTSVIALITLSLFLVTTADSATFQTALMVTRTSHEPHVSVRIFWAALTGACSLILLITGGLSGVQTASVVAALPLSFVVFVANISMIRAISRYEKQNPDGSFSVLRKNEGG